MEGSERPAEKTKDESGLEVGGKEEGEKVDVGYLQDDESETEGSRDADLYDDRSGSVHDDPGRALSDCPSVLVDKGRVVCVGRVDDAGHLDCEVVEHVWPVLALLHGRREDDIDGCDDGCEEGSYANDLEDVVCACEWPVVLCGEDEVEEEDDGECE